jgi:hypothetical protein
MGSFKIDQLLVEIWTTRRVSGHIASLDDTPHKGGYYQICGESGKSLGENGEVGAQGTSCLYVLGSWPHSS